MGGRETWGWDTGSDPGSRLPSLCGLGLNLLAGEVGAEVQFKAGPSADVGRITSWRWSAPCRASKSVSPERAGRARTVSPAAPAPTPGAGPPASGPPVAARFRPPLRRAPCRSTGLPLLRFLTRCWRPATAGEREPRGEAARARAPASVPALGAAARGGASSNRDVFSHGSRGQCSKVKVSQGHAPSGGCRGGLLPASHSVQQLRVPLGLWLCPSCLFLGPPVLGFGAHSDNPG